MAVVVCAARWRSAGGEVLVRLGSTVSHAPVRWPQLLPVESGDELESETLGDPDWLSAWLAHRRATAAIGRSTTLSRPARRRRCRRRSRVVEWSLWDSPWLFALVVACPERSGPAKRAGLA
jgi:hypothetical protein